jgi:hypothetical protein
MWAILFRRFCHISINVVNTKLVANFFLILLVLNFHNYRPDGLVIIDFRSLLSGSAYTLNKLECLVCLTCVYMESCLGDIIKIVVLLLSFPKSLRSLLLVVQISSYELSRWNDRVCPNLVEMSF